MAAPRSVRLPSVALVLAVGAALASLSGCIPVWRKTLLCPAGVVRVHDATTGAPLAGARVIVRRYNVGPPPSRESHRFEAVTAPDGRAVFKAQTAHEWVMPLMMHGVPQWAFDICVDADGHRGAAAPFLTQGMWTRDEDLAPQPELSVPLALGTGACESLSPPRRDR